MSDFELTPIRIAGGVWEGRLSRRSGTAEPRLAASLGGEDLPTPPRITPAAEGWIVQVPIPPEAISDGVQSFALRDAATGELLCAFSLIAGEAVAGDLRAELDLLRAELDLLKRAFRRHCVETGG